MKKTFLAILMIGFLFILVSCDSGTKKDTDKDLGTADTDVIADVEITDHDSPVTDHDSPVTDDTEEQDDSEYNDESEPPDEYEDSYVFPDEEPDDEFIPEEYTVDGFVQKGPFIKDSEIQITELDNNFEMIPSTSFTTKTIDDIGNFNIKRKFSSRYIEIKASGFYYNEVAGGVSSTQITNYVFVDLKANNAKISINILTTLARKRIQYLMKHGKNFNEARTQAETEILEIFGIFGETAANFQDMDILKSGNSNAMLLAISARLQGSNAPGELSSLTAGIIYEIEETGKLNDSTIKTKIADGGKHIALKLSEIRTNLENHFGSKTTVEVPNFEDFCDDNGNGIINKWEFDINFATKEKAERNTAYTSEEKTVKVNPATTAVAKTTAGTIVINGTDTSLSESPISDGDKLSVKVVSSNEFKTTVKADVTVEITVIEGKTENWIVEGSYVVTTVQCDNNDTRTVNNICGENNDGSQGQICTDRMWVNSGNCTRSFFCSAKPANSLWNSVSDYLQTWNGTAWEPVDTVAAYSTIASSTECRYKCETGYGFNGTHCVACGGNFPNWNNGQCWSDKSASTMTYSGAIDFCGVTLGGRLPTISELRMLIQNCSRTVTGGFCGVTDSCLNDSCAPGGKEPPCGGCDFAMDGRYSVFGDGNGAKCNLWSISHFDDFEYSSISWGVGFTNANVSKYEKSDSTLMYVRCIR